MKSFFAALKNRDGKNGWWVALKMVRKIFIKFKDFLKIQKFQNSRIPSWLHYGYIMATFDNLAKT